jgi:hypothetical protein
VEILVSSDEALTGVERIIKKLENGSLEQPEKGFTIMLDSNKLLE